jgi:hypothetical protein
LTRGGIRDSGYAPALGSYPLRIYGIEQAGSIFSLDTAYSGLSIERSLSRVRLSLETELPGSVTWRETDYPGWELYVNGKRTGLSRQGEAFKRWNVPQGKSDSVLLYRPAAFRRGLLLTILMVLLCAVAGARRLQRWERIS